MNTGSVAAHSVSSIVKCLLLSVIIFCWYDRPLHGQSSSTIHWDNCLQQPRNWYSGSEAQRIAENVLLYQYPSGGWPKNIDMASKLSVADVERLKAENHLDSATIDNRATYTQMRYLARVYRATKIERYRESFLRGFDYLIRAQYPNGGWPQFFPLRKGYYSHITFNDDAMIGVMRLLKDITDGKADFAFVDPLRREKALRAVARGIECILKCQIRVNGALTVWCAQHDEHDFTPAKARAYELPSLSGAESVGIVEFLMEVPHPSAEIKQSVQSAVSWFNKVRIHGIRMDEVVDPRSPQGKERVVVSDPSAPSLWARFYDIGTNKPFFSSRDGVKRDSLSQISYERRNHYSWLGDWPQHLLEKRYPQWVRKHGMRSVLN